MNNKFLKKLERVFKGVSNHWRIKILLVIDKNDKISLEEIVEKVKGNYPTISEHTLRLERSGLIYKKYKGKNILHTISPYGKSIIKYITSFKHSQ